MGQGPVDGVLANQGFTRARGGADDYRMANIEGIDCLQLEGIECKRKQLLQRRHPCRHG